MVDIDTLIKRARLSAIITRERHCVYAVREGDNWSWIVAPQRRRDWSSVRANRAVLLIGG